METLDPFEGVYRGITPIMENQMEKQMENEMGTLGPFEGVYREITPIMENQMDNEVETVLWEVSPHLREVLRIQKLS